MRSFPAAFSTVINARSSSLRLLVVLHLPTGGSHVHYFSTSDYTHTYGGAQTKAYRGVILDPGTYDQVGSADPMESRVGTWTLVCENSSSPRISGLFSGASFSALSKDFLDAEVLITTPELLEDAFTDGELDSIYSGDDYETLRAGLDGDHVLFVGWVADIPSYSERRITLKLTDLGGRFGQTLGTVVTTTNFPSAAPSAIGRILPIPVGSVSQLRFLPVVSGRKVTLTTAVPAPPSEEEAGYQEWTVTGDISGWSTTGSALVIPAGTRVAADAVEGQVIPTRNYPFVISWRGISGQVLTGVRWTMLSGSIGAIEAGSVILEVPASGLCKWQVDQFSSSLTHTVTDPRFDGLPPANPDNVILTNGGSGTRPEVSINVYDSIESRVEHVLNFWGAERTRGSKVSAGWESLFQGDDRWYTRRNDTAITLSLTGGQLSYAFDMTYRALDFLENLAGDVDISEVEVVQGLLGDSAAQNRLESVQVKWPETETQSYRITPAGVYTSASHGPAQGTLKVGRKEVANQVAAGEYTGKSANYIPNFVRASRLPPAARQSIPQLVTMGQVGPTGDPGGYVCYKARMQARVTVPEYVQEAIYTTDTSLPITVDATDYTTGDRYTWTTAAFSEYETDLQSAELAELHVEVEFEGNTEDESRTDEEIQSWASMRIILGANRAADGTNNTGALNAGEKIAYVIHGAELVSVARREDGTTGMEYLDRYNVVVPFKASLVQEYGPTVVLEFCAHLNGSGDATNRQAIVRNIFWKFLRTKRCTGKLFEAPASTESLGEYLGGVVTADVALSETNPSDVLLRYAQDQMGLAAAEINSASFATAKTRFTALAYEMGGAFTEPTTTKSAGLWQLANECRSLASWDGGQLRLTIREDSGDVGAVSDTIYKSDIVKLREVVVEKDFAAWTAQRVRLRFDRDYSQDRNDAAYRQVADSGYGAIERASAFAADFIPDEAAMATDVATFYSARHGQRGRILRLPLKLEWLKLLPGDIVGVDIREGDATAFDGLDGSVKFEVVDVDFVMTRRDSGSVPHVSVTLRECV